MKRTMTLLGLMLIATTAHTGERHTIKQLSSADVIEHIRSELPRTRTAEERTQSLTMFESLDLNRDNQVTFREMRRHPDLIGSFNRLDLNNDGTLNREELQPLQDEVKGIRGLLTMNNPRVI